MYRYDVYSGERAVGRAEVEEDGLYWRVRVRCAVIGGGIVRAAAENVAGRCTLGVLMPEKEVLTLTRRIARSRFSFFSDTYLTLDEAPHWTDFTADAAGWKLPGARVCRDGSGYAVYVPAETAKPFVCMPLFCFFGLVTRQNMPYWLMRLDAAHQPVMPQLRQTI
ncbi:MAG: hypothetical protein ACI3VP_06230 [Oscillospiraceae bacterium]